MPAPKSLDWSILKLAKGEKVTGVLAGRIRKYQCHHVGKHRLSKPCITYATEGKLKCWCVDRPASTRPVVYVPVFTRDDKVVVRMSAVQGWKLEQVAKPGHLVEFWRTERNKQPTFVRRIMGESASQKWVIEAAKLADADILEFLCHVWQLHALTRFCGFTPRRSVAAASTVDLSEPDYAPRFSHTEQLLAERTDAEGE